MPHPPGIDVGITGQQIFDDFVTILGPAASSVAGLMASNSICTDAGDIAIASRVQAPPHLLIRWLGLLHGIHHGAHR